MGRESQPERGPKRGWGWCTCRPERDELVRLRRENKQSRLERDILSKAAAWLVREWRAIPKDLPPRSTVNHHVRRWQYDGTLDRLYLALYVRCRERAGRKASPAAAIIDGQSIKNSEKRGERIAPPGPDGGKNIKGKK